MPKPAVEPEAVGAAAFEPPGMARAEAATEASVLPGMIEMIMGIVAARVVADPDSPINMRRIRVVRLIAKIATLICVLIGMLIWMSAIGRGLMLVAVIRRWSASRRRMTLMFLTTAMFVLLHGESGNAHHQQCR